MLLEISKKPVPAPAETAVAASRGQTAPAPASAPAPAPAPADSSAVQDELFRAVRGMRTSKLEGKVALDAVTKLLANGADVNAVDGSGRGALSIAIGEAFSADFLLTLVRTVCSLCTHC